jgi:hypothetical protein
MLKTKHHTLQVRRPFRHLLTLALAVPLLAVLLGALEGLARTAFAQSRLLTPSVSSDVDYMSVKLAALEQFVEENGPPDCLIVGSSMTAWGVDVQSLSTAYREVTGQPITCFNFALQAANAAEMSRWVEVLARKYHPWLVIYPNSAWDYNPVATAEVLEPAWLDYQQGQFTVEGWLVDHSYAYRYYLTYAGWTRSDFSPKLAERAELETQLALRDGFDAKTGVMDVSVIPDPHDYVIGSHLAYFYEVSAEDFAGLQHMVNFLHGQGIELVLVEVPLPATFMVFFDKGQTDYEKYVEQVGGYAASQGVPFWWTLPLDLIPDDGWYNYSHLNQDGAEVFSVWLGQRLGEAVLRGEIAPPHP